MKFEVHVQVEHWMYVEASCEEEAKEIAESAVDENTCVVVADNITDDEIEVVYAKKCFEVL